MDEAKWLNCTDPAPMLEYLRGKASDRKLRLFACACARAIWDLLEDERARQAVEAGERYADGLTTAEELGVASERAWEAVDACPSEANYSAQSTVEISTYDAAVDGARHASLDGVQLKTQCGLLREIFGNPFRPMTTDPSWLTPEVIALARVIYEERAFGRMRELADALQKARCPDADLLAHCGQESDHIRGCWVVDLILGETQIRMPGHILDLGEARRLRVWSEKVRTGGRGK
jgi:hypothetical protein